ncbi:HNH endonuclease domain protein [Mycolicibacterium smegmatis MKD8]|uniref:HNH endonuclease domain protein n=1 Tax=Mycolicibacterium smegmatis (strain MKD8) TaxID=1214915 RepID=A0A2U9PJ84_MYCSE|nr:HNH endonuclease domain protein [Mycolicibacterium smegmatis MKD8]
MRGNHRWTGRADNFLHTAQHSAWFGWPARWLAVVCAITLTVGGLHLVTAAHSPPPAEQAAATITAAQGFADAAVSVFAESAVSTDPTLTPQARRAGLPEAPVAGLTAQTAAGPVQVVLPGGLGNAQHTAGGQVVYPNAGAGFDMLAENTGSGTRTVARISGPAGPRMVTTFVRTPADTVMLAHTNGYLTINRATAAAETIGMFSPAETRDATGQLVPSSYVVKQLAPQLYALAEVIDPQPHTTWPVYVDPPLHTGGPSGGSLPVGLFDSVTNTVSSLADTATSAVTTVASATVSGAEAVGGFVKENPLESALLVGGVALAVTGVGGPAGAAMIASATVNISSAAVDIAAAAMPDNQALGIASTVLGAASMVTPQGAAKKAVTEGAELAAEQLAKHTDDLAKAAGDTALDVIPTPRAQLANDITTTGPATPPVTPGVLPKAPNAPPATAKPSAATDIAADGPCGCLASDAKGGVYEVHATDGVVKTGRTNDLKRRAGEHRRRKDLPPHETVPVHRTDDHAEQRGLEQEVREQNFDTADKSYGGFDKINGIDPRSKRAAEFREAARAHHERWGTQSAERTSTPNERRAEDEAQAQAVTDKQRDTARDSARRANESGSQRSGDSGSSKSGDKSDRKSEKKKKQSTNKKRRKGQK